MSVAAKGDVRQGFALGDHLGELLVDRGPFVFGTGHEAFGRQGALVGIMATGLDAARLRRLDDHLRPVDMAGDEIAARVDERIGGLGLAHRQGPLAREDHLHRGIGVDGPCANQEFVDVAQHDADGLGGDKAELAGLRGGTGRDAIDIMTLIEEGEVGARVLRVGRLPQRRRMAELDTGIGLRLIHHEGAVVAEGGRQDELGRRRG